MDTTAFELKGPCFSKPISYITVTAWPPWMSLPVAAPAW